MSIFDYFFRKKVPMPEIDQQRNCIDDPCFFAEPSQDHFAHCQFLNKDIEINLAPTCPAYRFKTPSDRAQLDRDIADMKAAIGELKAIKVVQVIEKKGGAIGLNQEESLSEVSQGGNTYVLKKTINISTPSAPTGIIVLKYALMVSFAIKYVGGSPVYCKVDIDDVTLVEVVAGSSSYVYYDRAKEVSAGSHTVKFYLKGGNGWLIYLKDARAICGLGTIGTDLTRVADIAVSGDSKALVKVGGKSWSASPTVTAVVNADESDVDKITVTQVITQGGSLYENYGSLTTFIYQMLGYSIKTSNANVPAFLTCSEDKSVKMMLL